MARVEKSPEGCDCKNGGGAFALRPARLLTGLVMIMLRGLWFGVNYRRNHPGLVYAADTGVMEIGT